MPAPRWIDLHVDWLLQYAPETNLFESRREEIKTRLGQLDGYLGATSAAFLPVETWESIARYEAEFAGRLIYGAEDQARFRDDPQGLTWGVLACSGFEADRWPRLFDRGVRVFRPTGSGREFLDVVATLEGSRPILDLGGCDPAMTASVLDWFEAAPSLQSHVLLIHRGGAISTDDLRRFRALGVTIAIRARSADTLREAIESAAALPFLGREGFEGIALASGFLSGDPAVPGPGNAPELISWVSRTFEPDVAGLLLRENAWKLIAAMAEGQP